MGSSTGYQRHSRARWQELFAEQGDSSLSQTAFGREHGLAAERVLVREASAA